MLVEIRAARACGSAMPKGRRQASCLRQVESHLSFPLAGSLGLAVLLRDLESDGRAETKADSYGTVSLRRIFGCCWHEYMSNDLGLKLLGSD